MFQRKLYLNWWVLFLCAASNMCNSCPGTAWPVNEPFLPWWVNTLIACKKIGKIYVLCLITCYSLTKMLFFFGTAVQVWHLSLNSDCGFRLNCAIWILQGTNANKPTINLVWNVCDSNYPKTTAEISGHGYVVRYGWPGSSQIQCLWHYCSNKLKVKAALV